MSKDIVGGHFSEVEKFFVHFDEVTGKFIITFPIEGGMVQVKLSEVSILLMAKIIIEAVMNSKELYKR